MDVLGDTEDHDYSKTKRSEDFSWGTLHLPVEASGPGRQSLSGGWAYELQGQRHRDQMGEVALGGTGVRENELYPVSQIT